MLLISVIGHAMNYMISIPITIMCPEPVIPQNPLSSKTGNAHLHNGCLVKWVPFRSSKHSNINWFELRPL